MCIIGQTKISASLLWVEATLVGSCAGQLRGVGDRMKTRLTAVSELVVRATSHYTALLCLQNGTEDYLTPGHLGQVCFSQP